MGYEDEKKDSIEETSECFWDYFLFDYHLLRSDKRPLEFFYERTCLPESDDYDEEFAKRNRDVLEEYAKQGWLYSKLTVIQMTVLFIVQTG